MDKRTRCLDGRRPGASDLSSLESGGEADRGIFVSKDQRREEIRCDIQLVTDARASMKYLVILTVAQS